MSSVTEGNFSLNLCLGNSKEKFYRHSKALESYVKKKKRESPPLLARVPSRATFHQLEKVNLRYPLSLLLETVDLRRFFWTTNELSPSSDLLPAENSA